MPKTKARQRQLAGEVRGGAGSAFSRGNNSADSRGRQRPKHGTVKGDTWAKVVRGSQHRLRTPPAWAMDTADLDAAERCGVQYVRLHDLESLAEFWASTATIRQHGWALDRGHGEQVALSLGWWRPTRELAEAVAPKEPAGVQLSLFEVAR